MTTLTGLLEWWANGERGLSSETMASAVAGQTPRRVNWPYDPDDFRRCVLFLDAVPDARSHLDRVAALSSQWAALVARWEEIEATALTECPHFPTKRQRCRCRAPRTYALIKECIR